METIQPTPIPDKQSPTTSLMTLKWIMDWEHFKALSDDWIKLQEEISDGLAIFQTYGWCHDWAKAFTQDRQTRWSFQILTGWEKDQLVLLCPLAIHRHGGTRIANWLGDPMTQYGSPLVRRDSHQPHRLEQMWRAIETAQGLDLAHLKLVRHDSIAYPHLSQTGSSLGSEQAVSIDLTQFASWQELEDWFNARHRRSTRRGRKQQQRRLFQLGEIQFNQISNTDQAHAALQEILTFKAAWLEQNGLRSSTFADKATLALLERLINLESNGIQRHIFQLTIDGKPVAYDIGFSNNGRFVSHIGAFHPDYANASPGSHLMERILDYLIEQKFEWFDLMTPAYGYKLKWGTNLDDVTDFALPTNWKGRAYLHFYLLWLRPTIKKGLNNLPLPLKRLAKKLQDKAFCG